MLGAAPATTARGRQALLGPQPQRRRDMLYETLVAQHCRHEYATSPARSIAFWPSAQNHKPRTVLNEPGTATAPWGGGQSGPDAPRPRTENECAGALVAAPPGAVCVQKYNIDRSRSVSIGFHRTRPSRSALIGLVGINMCRSVSIGVDRSQSASDLRRRFKTDRDRPRPIGSDRDRSRPTETDRDQPKPIKTERDRSRPIGTDRGRQISIGTDRATA